MMYTVCWTEISGGGDSIYRWERFESRSEVAGFLIREGLEDEEDILIFGPEADESLLTTENILSRYRRVSE